MGSSWTHSICVPCWNELNPGRELHPDDCVGSRREVCCWCTQETQSGIYTRHNPADDALQCKGNHEGEPQ